MVTEICVFDDTIFLWSPVANPIPAYVNTINEGFSSQYDYRWTRNTIVFPRLTTDPGAPAAAAPAVRGRFERLRPFLLAAFHSNVSADSRPRGGGEESSGLKRRLQKREMEIRFNSSFSFPLWWTTFSLRNAFDSQLQACQ